MHCPARKQELLEIYRRSFIERPLDQEAALRFPEGGNLREGAQEACVGLVVRECTAGLEFLLTLRSDSVKQHAGQVCLPGGVVERNESRSYLKTLDREFNEEVGMRATSIEWAPEPWETLTSRYGIKVFPFLGIVKETEHEEIVLQPSEVADAAWLPLANLFDATFWSHRTLIASKPSSDGAYRSAQLPLWTGWAYVTWGLTARFLELFVRRISGRTPIGLDTRAPL